MPRELRPFGVTDVEIDDEFWSPRIRTNREVTLRYEYEMLEESGRLENFRRAAEGEGEFQGRFYNDSDVYKWLEAACHVLATEDDGELRARVNEVATLVEAAQEDDGYLNTYFTLEVGDAGRWTNSAMHELYCAGHFFEAAIAHHRATGEQRLLAVARRFADLIDEVFGPDGRHGVPGHEEIELALVELARETGEQRYLDLARFFLDERGQETSPMRREVENLDEIAGASYNPDGIDTREIYRDHMTAEDGSYEGTYAQDHRPVREQEAVVGHAVRATYLYSGVADVAAETDDDALREAVERLWRNMAERCMYVTGGLGTSYENEGFTEDYDLPNDTAYAETCAAIGNVFWNHRMLQLTGDGKYADCMERALYNGVLPGVSLDGTRFRYTNPLEARVTGHPQRDLDPERYDQERFSYEREDWFTCSCCPTNVVRLFASLDQYVYMEGDGEIAVNLYVAGSGTTTVDGTAVTIEQSTDYPWDGSIALDLDVDGEVTFELALRIPGSCTGATVRLDDERVDPPVEDGYVRLDRTWSDGDRVTLDLELPVRQVEGHPSIPFTAGRVALRRGPIVYCLEDPDNPDGIHDLRIPRNASFDTAFDPDLLGGVTVIEGEADRPDPETWEETLYRSRREPSTESTTFTAIPYYAWGHREDGAMSVWLPTS